MTYNIFVDAAGRVSRATHGYEYLTSAGVGVPEHLMEWLRGRLDSSVPKWRDATIESLDHVSGLLSTSGIHSLSVRMFKATPEWADFWKKAEALARGVASLTHKKATFIKAAHIVRYGYFAEVVGRLTGEMIRRDGLPPILDPRGRHTILLNVTCDSDLQGKEPINLFHYLWERHEGSGQDLLLPLRVRVAYRDVRLLTEQQEPLLLLADYLAGLVHCTASDGCVSPPKSYGDGFNGLKRALGELRSHVNVATKFQDRIEEIFGDSFILKVLNATRQ